MGIPFTPKSPNPRILDPSHGHDVISSKPHKPTHLPSVTTLIRASSIFGQLLITKNRSETFNPSIRKHTFTNLAFVLDGNELKTKSIIRFVPVMMF